VKNYVTTMFGKLGLEQRTQAAAYAARAYGRVQARNEPEYDAHRPQAWNRARAGHDRGGRAGR